MSLVIPAISVASVGCSGTPPDGTQVNVGISKEKAEQQNKAFSEYSKQNRSKPQQKR